MKKNDTGKKYKTYLSWAIVFIFCGLLLICLGTIQYFFGEHNVVINSRYHQPVVDNGTIQILFGIVFLITGFYRLIFKRKAFEEENIIINTKIEEDRKLLKSRGFSKKEIKKRTNPKFYK